MNLSKVIIVNCLYALFGAVVMTLMPVQIMQPYGLLLDKGGVFIAGLLGAALLGFAILYFQLRNSKDKSVIKSLSVAAIVTHLLSALIGAMSITSGTLNSMAWVDAGLHVLLALGFWQYGLNRK